MSQAGSIIKLTTRSADETMLAGSWLGRILQKGDVVLLKGQIGAGKTTFSKGIARGLGIDDEYVSSPTYAIVNVYEHDPLVYHIDLYRFAGSNELRSNELSNELRSNELSDELRSDELEASGIFDYPLEEAISLVEWPGRLDIESERVISLSIKYVGTGNIGVDTDLDVNIVIDEARELVFELPHDVAREFAIVKNNHAQGDSNTVE